MRNRIGLILAAPLMALIFATAGSASAAPEQRLASQLEQRAKSKQGVQHLARYDRERKKSYANRYHKARPAAQKTRKAARTDQNRYRHHHHMRGPVHSHQGRKIRGENRSPTAWRNIYKRPGQARRPGVGNSGKHWHRHGWSDRNRSGQPGLRHGQNKRGWGGEHRMKDGRTLADRFKPDPRTRHHRSHHRPGAYR